MGEGRKPDLLEPQKVTTAATVQSCKWKCICYQEDERGASGITKYDCGEENSIFLQQKKTADGKEKRTKQCCFQVRIERALTEHNRGDILNLQEILVKQWDIKNKEKVMD